MRDTQSLTVPRWGWVPDLVAAFSRFPLAVLIAALFVLYHIGDVRVVMGLSRDLGDRISYGLIAAFLWTVAVDFYAEGVGWPRRYRSMLWLGGALAIGLLAGYAIAVWLNPLVLIAGLFLLIPIAPFLNGPADNASLWQFNYRLWEGAVFALVGALLFGAGLSLILESLNFLFGAGLASDWHRDIWIVSLGFLAPVGWLSFAPTDLKVPVRDGEQADVTARALLLIVRFVLVPLLLVYTAILYAYAVKIAFETALPSGTVAGMVVGYVLTCAATLFLAYPIRESGNALVRFFWRYWVWLCLPPVLLLLLATYQRIAQYGLTEQRFVVLLIGLWILGLALIEARRSSRRDLRLVPGLLAGMLLIASAGPWGALGLSVLSQKGELSRLLTESGQLVDGQVVSSVMTPTPESRMDERASRVRAIQWYLSEKRSLNVIAPWFEGHPAAPFRTGNPPEKVEHEVLTALGVRPDLPPPGRDVYISHFASQPDVLALSGFSHVVGPLVFEQPQVTLRTETVALPGFGNIRLSYAEGALTVTADNGATIRFDLNEAARRHLLAQQRTAGNAQQPLRIESTGSGLSGILLIENLTGTYQPPMLDVGSVRVWLALGRGNGQQP
jgi:hypothetical protein